MHVFLTWAGPFWIFFDKGLVNRRPDTFVINIAKGLIKQPIPDLQPHPWVSHYILVPASHIREVASSVVSREKVKVAVVFRAIYCD